MKLRKNALFIVVVCLVVESYGELFTLGAMAIGGIGSYIAYSFRCSYMECCDTKEVPYNTDLLKTRLNIEVFGQPLVQEVVHILRGHVDNFRNEKRGRKALTLSFHGWTGSGKNHVASIIAESLYTRGMNSRFVKLYVGKHHFPNPSRVHEYRQMLIMEIKQTVLACPLSLIIFDEVNEFPPGLIDVIKPMAEHYGTLDGVDYSGVVFILISNIGGDQITKQFLQLNKPRDLVTFAEFEHVIRDMAIKKGGFEGSSVIFSQMIDHYIPFLPLEQTHVEKCAMIEFRNQGYWKPSLPMIEEALSTLTYGPPGKELFANAGCKRIKKQVAYVLHKKK